MKVVSRFSRNSMTKVISIKESTKAGIVLPVRLSGPKDSCLIQGKNSVPIVAGRLNGWKKRVTSSVEDEIC